MSRTTLSALPSIALVALVVCQTSDSASAQRRKAPANEPASCPYCGGEPERMQASGVISHGPFEFGQGDTAAIDSYFSILDVRWIETEHFEIGVALGPYRPPQKEKKKLRAELEALSLTLPEVKPKAKVLDAWLRAHLFAQRAEDALARFLEIVDVDISVFPDGSKPWDRTGTYWGEGPHLGEKGKFEVLLLPSQAVHLEYLTHEYGLQIKQTQRWNVLERDSISVTAHSQAGALNRDTAMHGHVVFNLAHNFLDGFRHYSYETPIWLHEGLAHYMEREISPEYNSFDSSEGGVAEESKKTQWHKEVLKLVRKKEAPRMAVLMGLKSYAELTIDQHFTTWSMAKYLVEQRPVEFAAFITSLKGFMNEDGVADGSEMPRKHRESFKQHLGLSYSQFDQAWSEWVLGIEPEPDDDAPLFPGGGG